MKIGRKLSKVHNKSYAPDKLIEQRFGRYYVAMIKDHWENKGKPDEDRDL